MADMGTLASSKGLEQFVLLAKSAKGAAVVELINQVLATPGIYVFGELLEMPSVKDVSEKRFMSHYITLDYFVSF